MYNFSYILLSFSDGDKELERLKLRDNLSEEDALSRINAQMPIEEKKKRGTILIDNNGTIDELKQQVRPYVFMIFYNNIIP